MANTVVLEWATAENVREANKRALINLIRREKTISQAELSRKIGLSKPAISALVKDLKRRELIIEVGIGDSEMGRKPTLLSLNPSGGYILGVDFDLFNIEIGIIDLVNEIKFSRKITLDSSQSSDDIFKYVTKSLNDFMQDSEIPRSKFMGIGVCLPGAVDPIEGIATEIRPYRWKDVPVKNIFEQNMSIPTSVETSAIARCLAEQSFGNGLNSESFILAKVSGGLGVTFVLEGHRSGNNVNALNGFGHQVIPDEESPVVCSCGKKGCIQTIASGRGVMGFIREHIDRGGETIIKELMQGNGGTLTLEHFFEAAASSDPFALDLLDLVARALGIGLGTASDLLGIRKIIMSGSLIEKSRGLLMGEIEKYTRQHVVSENHKSLEVVETDLHETIGLLSTAAIVYQNLFGKVSV
jgi:N-acetylglucosamine repressor